MTKDEFKTYLNGLKKNFEQDNEELEEKSPQDEEVGIAYNDGCINIIDLVLLRLEELE